MRIRRFYLSDSKTLARLHRDTIRIANRADYTPAQIRVWSERTTAKRFRDSSKKVTRFVALEKGKLVGFGDFSEKEKELTGLYIHTHYLNKGIGAKLLLRLEKEALKKGIRTLTTTSTITAKAFYEKHGYTTLRKTFYKIGNQKLPVYKMRKKLT